MAKIEIIQQLDEEFRLDLYQLQIIGLYNNLLLDENILGFLRFLGSSGYMIYIGEKDGKPYFDGLEPKRLDPQRKDGWWWDQHKGVPIETATYQTYVINYCREILTAWHKGTSTPAYVGLTKKQRGILTKILKIENKRKRLVTR